LYQEWYSKYGGIVEGFASRVDKLLAMQQKKNDRRAKRELEQVDRDYSYADQKNKELYDAKLITEEEYNKRHEELVQAKAAKESRIKKKQAEEAKEIAIQQAIIDGISSVMKTLASYQYPVNLIFAALDAGIVAAEVVNMQNTPAYAAGGFHTNSNTPQGYTNGATLYTGSASGQPFIAGEAGREYIVPNWMLQDPATANIIDQLENVRQNRSFASGGPTTAAPASNNNADRLAAAIEQLNYRLAMGIPAYMDYNRFKSIEAKIDFAKASARS
jgi:hypothetical protein